MLLSNEYQNDPSITRLLHAVARICYERGVKQMLTVKCWKQKQTAIQTLLPQNIDTPNNCFSESYLISFIQKHPILFSIASDCVAPLVKLLVSLKRKVRGRINVNWIKWYNFRYRWSWSRLGHIANRVNSTIEKVIFNMALGEDLNILRWYLQKVENN